VVIRLVFDTALDASVAANRGNYHVVHRNVRRPRQERPVPVRAASYDASSQSVTLVLGRSRRAEPLWLFATGLVGTNTPVANLMITDL
jgi:hypothetical protein